MTELKTPELEDGRQLEDMSTQEIARVMVKIQRMRWARWVEIKRLSEVCREAKRDAVKGRAGAFLAHVGPQEERTQTAKFAAADLEFAYDAAKSELEACKEAMSLLKDDWDTCRSINANERATKNALEGYGS